MGPARTGQEGFCSQSGENKISLLIHCFHLVLISNKETEVARIGTPFKSVSCSVTDLLALYWMGTCYLSNDVHPLFTP